MNKADVSELIRGGENSGVEFKRAEVRPEQLATEIAALLNLEGGRILLGVEDKGSVTGLIREPRRVEEWVMETARTHVLPAAIPYWETVDWGNGKIVGVISLPRDAPDKPYKARRGGHWITQVRVGTTTRAAGREEEERLYLQGGQFRIGLKPVLGTGIDSLDRWEFPEEAVREAVVNALVHRDYSIVGTDVMLVIFSDRLEVVSPGRLPNTVTPEGMRLGMRYARNQTLVNVMRDCGYVDARGMGIRNKIIPGMWSHNGTEPDLIAEEYRFTVRLWKDAKPS